MQTVERILEKWKKLIENEELKVRCEIEEVIQKHIHSQTKKAVKSSRTKLRFFNKRLKSNVSKQEKEMDDMKMVFRTQKFVENKENVLGLEENRNFNDLDTMRENNYEDEVVGDNLILEGEDAVDEILNEKMKMESSSFGKSIKQDDIQKNLEIMRQQEELGRLKRAEEIKILEEIKKQEEIRRAEDIKRQEEIRIQSEMERQEKIRIQNEIERQEEIRIHNEIRRQEKIKKMEEIKKIEDLKKQEENRKNFDEAKKREEIKILNEKRLEDLKKQELLMNFKKQENFLLKETVKSDEKLKNSVEESKMLWDRNEKQLRLKNALLQMKAKNKTQLRSPIHKEEDPFKNKDLLKTSIRQNIINSSKSLKFNSNYYRPKMVIPEIDSDEMSRIECKIDIPMWANNPKISTLISLQSHIQLENMFKNEKPINLQVLFPEAKDISNDSPNKWGGE